MKIGKCSVCGLTSLLTWDGKMRIHQMPRNMRLQCPGSKKPPQPIQEAKEVEE